MNYWLIKTEPEAYSWDMFAKDKTTFWDGVRNYQARNNLREMRKGDVALFYHTGEERRIMGLCTVVKEAYQDPTTDETAWVAVDVKVSKAMPQAVTLAAIKQAKGLENTALIKHGRLSVVPITAKEYAIIIALSTQS